MNTEQRQQLKEIYEIAAECEPSQRPPLLAQLCGDDHALRAEVEALLELLPQADDFIEEPPALAAALLNEVTNSLSSGRRLGTYEVLDELGRGGMGVVYLAVRADDAYRKEVAIKLVWPGFDSNAITRRFHQERQILANLDHPNITRLLDGGATEEGWPYLVMEYVNGQPIHQYCNEQRLSVKERLKLFQQVCAAVEYAHRHFVVHRDLKPSNILVTKTGQIKLLDFGIAKILDPSLRPDATSLTHTGLHALTPEYASPEQVRGAEITTASDVYSLGVVLYELLTGQQPYHFPNRALHEVMRVIAEAEPLRPSLVGRPGLNTTDVETGTTNPSIVSAQETTSDKLRRRLTGDLDKITLKALRKEPEQRYATVEELSADLARHLAGEPVQARQPTLSYRTGKFIRRHPTSVAVALTLLLALLAAFIYAVSEARQQRRLAYAARIRQASADWFEGNPRSYEEILQTPPVQPRWGEEDLRGLEWRYLWRLGHRERLSFAQTDRGEFDSSNNKLFTWQDNPFRFTVRDALTGQALMEQSPTTAPTFIHSYLHFPGQIIALYQTYGHTLMKMDMLSSARQPLFDDPSPVTSLVANDQIELVTGHANGQVKRWERQTGRALGTLATAVGSVRGMEQTSDNQRLVTLSTNNTLQVFDIPQQRELLRLKDVASFVFHWNPKCWMVVHSTNNLISVYDPYAARKLSALDTSDNPPVFVSGHTEYRLAVGHQDNMVKLYELPSLRLLGNLTGHQSWVNTAMFSADHKRLLTGSSDRTIKLWDVTSQQELATLRGHHADVVAGFWFDQDRQFASISSDHVFKVWDTAEVLRPDVLTGHKGLVFSTAFAPDNRTLASASKDRTVKLWNTETGALLKTLPGHKGQVLCVNFSPDGQRLVSSGEGQAARVWEVATGKLLFELCCHQAQMHFATFSPDGKWIATASDDSTVKLWDAATGREVRTLSVSTDKTGRVQNIWSLAFAPDSRTLLSGTQKGEVHWWDVASGRALAAFHPHGDASIWSIAFTADGQQFATASGDNTVRLWRTDTQQLIREFKGHADGLFELAFSPDGQRLVTASRDKTVRFWNVATGQELLILKGHTDQVWSVAFAPDGNTLASGSWDGTVRLWRAATDLPNAPR